MDRVLLVVKRCMYDVTKKGSRVFFVRSEATEEHIFPQTNRKTTGEHCGCCYNTVMLRDCFQPCTAAILL